jgi:hypothetical protein
MKHVKTGDMGERESHKNKIWVARVGDVNEVLVVYMTAIGGSVRAERIDRSSTYESVPSRNLSCFSNILIKHI